MDPATMMMLMSLVSTGIGAFSGNEGEQKSSFSSPQQGGINDILQSIKGMKNGAQDVTKNQNYQTGQDWLQSMFNDPDFFQKFEAPIQRNYEENIIPDLSAKFSSMGSGGSAGSTAFRNQLAREGSNLSTNLAALRGNMQQNAIPQLQSYSQQPFSNIMQMYQQALGQPVMNQYQPSSAGVGALAAPFAQGAASYWGGQGGQGGQRFPGQSASTY